MPFHSLFFIYCFLPASIALICLAKKKSYAVGLWTNIVLSGAFIAYGDFFSLGVVFISAVCNYFIGRKITAGSIPRTSLWAGVTLNVLLLCLFKYAPQSSLHGLVMPLGISFYTFSQISYLVEARGGKVASSSFSEYLAYTLFFPKFLAGPIARTSEFLPQLRSTFGTWDADRILRASAFLLIGLFKKAVIADQLQPFASYAFDTATSPASFYMAWQGATVYGMQLYFDFSGYSDMAIGIALALGICLPINFNAPYRSLSVTDFWRRWHMTLSSFFRDYIYIPLGGNRRGTVRKYLHLFVVMLACGIWHGSGWTFVIWGAMHGIYLVLHNVWLSVKKIYRIPQTWLVGRFVGWALTFLCVTVAWVPFRATSLHSAIAFWKVMLRLPTNLPNSNELLLLVWTVGIPLAIVLLFPTTQNWLRYTSYEKSQEIGQAPAGSAWPLRFGRGFTVGIIGVVGILFLLNGGGFIYANF